MSAAIARCIRSSSATSSNRHYTPGMYLEDHPSVATDLLSTDNEDVDDDFIIEQTSTPGSSVVDTTPSSVTNSFTPTSFYTTPVGDLTSRARLLDENINLTPSGPPMNKTSRRPDVGSIMQQQQALLEKILHNQQSMKEWKREIESKLVDLESKIKCPTSPSPSSSNSTSRKRKVTRDLSVWKFII